MNSINLYSKLPVFNSRYSGPTSSKKVDIYWRQVTKLDRRLGINMGAWQLPIGRFRTIKVVQELLRVRKLFYDTK